MDLSSWLLNFYFKYQNASSFKKHKNPTQYGLSNEDILPHIIRPSHNEMLLGDPGGVNLAAQPGPFYLPAPQFPACQACPQGPAHLTVTVWLLQFQTSQSVSGG